MRGGRGPKEVTLDPAMAACAAGLASAAGGLSPEQLVRAVSALSRIRVLHTPLLEALRSLPTSAWRAMPPASVSEAVAAYAWFGLEDHSLKKAWKEVLDEQLIARLPAAALANLIWAAATLQMDGSGGLYGGLCAATAAAKARFGFAQLSKVAWGLARLRPAGAAHPWAASLAEAVTSSFRPAAGQSLAQLLWAFSEAGDTKMVRSLYDRARAASLGKDAYAVLMQTVSPPEQADLLLHMAKHCESDGLRSAALNAAAMQAIRDGRLEKAAEVLRDMAARRLWNRVTYLIATRLAAASGTELQVEGQPPFPGLVDPGPRAHKYVRAAYHALARATPGDIESVLAGLEDYSEKKGWLKFGAAYEKGDVIDTALRALPPRSRQRPAVAVEFGTFLGYSALRLARGLGPGARIVSFEVDPEVACLAMNLIEFAQPDAEIDIWVGYCEDLAPRLVDTLGKRSVDLVYMDHNQITYHEDLAQLEALGVLADGALLCATQGLKPGAPLMLWRLAEGQKAGRCSFDVVSTPDCGCPLMEEWVVLASLRADERPWEPPPPPHDLVLLAAECNLMRWRTAKGLVDEHRWNGFVQHVRRRVHEIAGIQSSRDAWPDPAKRDKARSLEYARLDY